MKRLFILVAIAAILFSCKTTNQPNNGKMVDVTISFAGIDVQVTPEDAPSRLPAASDKGVTDAKVKRIALSVFDLNGVLIKSAKQNKNADATDFGTITMRIPIGGYVFVAVADTSTSTADVATINSVSEVSFGSAQVCNPTYTALQIVNIEGNTTQNVTVDMGTRKNATFAAQFKDDNPSDVTKIQIIISPDSTAYSDLKVNPSTGLAAAQWKYERTFDLTALQVTTVKNKNFNLPLMLTSEIQIIDVTINALSATDKILYTRTIGNVPFEQAHKTVATGTFFSPEVTTSFSFDITEETYDISLD